MFWPLFHSMPDRANFTADCWNVSMIVANILNYQKYQKPSPEEIYARRYVLKLLVNIGLHSIYYEYAVYDLQKK